LSLVSRSLSSRIARSLLRFSESPILGLLGAGFVVKARRESL
jgi:hypothetical protein